MKISLKAYFNKIPESTKIWIKYRNNYIETWVSGHYYPSLDHIFLTTNSLITHKICKDDVLAVYCYKKHIIKKNFILW